MRASCARSTPGHPRRRHSDPSSRLGHHLPLDLRETVKQSSESASRTLADADRDHILETLKQSNWLIGGQDGAASRLGLPRTTLIYRMRKLGIETRRSLGAHSAAGG